jgi:hypothetical protein
MNKKSQIKFLFYFLPIFLLSFLFLYSANLVPKSLRKDDSDSFRTLWDKAQKKAIDQQLAAGHGQFAFVAKPGPIFTRTERRLFAFSLIGALVLIGAGALEIARPGTLPAFNAAAVQPAPQAVAFPVCRPEGA